VEVLDATAHERRAKLPAMNLPNDRPMPGVDDHLVEPEITRDEIVRGLDALLARLETERRWPG
jgi:hypothetical protein